MKHSIIDGHYQSQTLCRKIELAVASLQQQCRLCGHTAGMRAVAVQQHTHAAQVELVCAVQA